jgi:hypothetical protein
MGIRCRGLAAESLLASSDAAQPMGIRCFLSDGQEFPQHLKASFKRTFLENATCARCGGQSTEIALLLLVKSGGKKDRPHIVCGCGYPVWRISDSAYFAVTEALVGADRSRERRIRNIELGGKHSSKEIREIRTFQGNRCIYCDVEFTDDIRPDKDHVCPRALGGGDWALNIVLACKRCNSLRRDIPFRTFCKLLSPTQNRRILTHLSRRISAVPADQRTSDAFIEFLIGIKAYNHMHSRYRKILQTSSVARKNAAINQLIPNDPDLILRKASLLLLK